MQEVRCAQPGVHQLSIRWVTVGSFCSGWVGGEGEVCVCGAGVYRGRGRCVTHLGVVSVA